MSTGTRQLRVLAITTAYPAPGSHKGAFLKSEVEGLREQGIDVTVMQLRGKFVYLRGALRTFGASLSGRYDIIHGHYSFCGMVARAQVRLPTVVTFWGSDILKSPLVPETRQGRLSHAISPLLARMADACIVPSEEMAKILAGARITVVPQGVDFSTFRVIEQVEARRALALNPDLNYRYVLFCANPALPVKGYPIAENAVRLLQESGEQIELIVAKGLTQEQVAVYMNACDVLALPSYWEGGPYVVKESMACNLPVVATNVGDVANVITGTKGCFIAERTAEDFAHFIRSSLHEVRRTTGRQDIKHMSRAVATARIIAVYEDVLSRRTHTADLQHGSQRTL